MGQVSFEVMGHEVKLIDDGDRVVYHVLNGGSFEPNTLAHWAAICSNGGEVLDIGGYTGLFSILAAKAGARPVCIEPLPDNQQRIRQNFRLNDVTATLIPAAATNHNGEVTIGYNPAVVGL